MELFFMMFIDFIMSIIGLLNTAVFTIFNIEVTLLQLVLVPICIYVFLRVFWKGERG